MEISVGTNILEDGPAKEISPELLKILAAGGIKTVDLHAGTLCDAQAVPPKVINRFIDYTRKKQILRLKSWLKDLDMRPVCMHSACCCPLDPSRMNKDIRQISMAELKMCIGAAGELEVPVMVVHAGDTIGEGESLKGKLIQLRKSIAELLPLARRNNVRLAFENVYYPDSLFCRLQDLVDFVKEIGEENVGICLDTGHFNLIDGHNISEAVLKSGPKLYALHVHDNDGSFDQHLLPFEGNINWRGFIAALEQVGYGGTLNLEVRRPEADKSPTAEFVRKARDSARSLLHQR